MSKLPSTSNKTLTINLLLADSNPSRTDVDMKRLGLVESAEGAWGQLSEEAFYLFEELFEICKRPNEAEIDMLGRVVRMDPVDIQRWCKFHIGSVRTYTNLYCS